MSGPALVPRRPWTGRRVVLGVTGGIAAYKSVQVARDLTRLGAVVDVVMTSGARQFVQPISFRAVTGRDVHSDLFPGTGPAPHIELAQGAEVVAVAPATANFIARAAAGMADDLLTTLLLATRAPVVVFPAMNDRMFSHPQTQANLKYVAEALGYEVAGPATGPLAVGEGEGPGRMLEPSEVVAHVGRALGRESFWEHRRVLVTAGPTREPLDPVRFLGNRSSGRMGYALAEAAWRRGAQVTLVTGPTLLPPPPGVEMVRVETAEEMEKAAVEMTPEADVLLFAAAVADFRPAEAKEQKIKRSGGRAPSSLELRPTADVARSALQHRKPGAFAVGFALETEDLAANARKKLKEKGFDLVVANPALEEGAGFEVATNRVTLLSVSGEPEAWPRLTKEEVAERLMDRVRAMLEERR